MIIVEIIVLEIRNTRILIYRDSISIILVVYRTNSAREVAQREAISYSEENIK